MGGGRLLGPVCQICFFYEPSLNIKYYMFQVWFNLITRYYIMLVSLNEQGPTYLRYWFFFMASLSFTYIIPNSGEHIIDMNKCQLICSY